MTRRDWLTAAAGVTLQGQPALAQTRYQPDWASLDRRPTPAWFTDAKFGIFIHWGIYSVPAFAPPHTPNETPYAEWYWNSLMKGKRAQDANSRGNPTSDFHARVYCAQFEYAQFAPQFKAELFDPDQWAQAFEQAGAKYVVLTSKHHDGFCLWPSAEADRHWQRPWNSVSTGPRRDLLGDLSAAVRRRNLRMGFYYSLYEWYNPLWLTGKARYIREHMQPQFKDVVTRYRPSMIFSDGEWDLPSAEWQSPELLAWLYNQSPSREEVIVNDRWGKETRHKHGGYWTTEYTAGMDAGGQAWEENRGMGQSYGYNRVEQLADYRSGRELVLMLIDLVSRGGNLLLDIGPAADGTIPVIMQDRLAQIGAWLRVNGDAIYGTRPWTRTRQWSAGQVPELKTGERFMTRYEVADLVDGKNPGLARVEAFFTRKGADVFAIVPGWPGSEFVLKEAEVGGAVEARLLGYSQALPVRRSGQTITVGLPARSTGPGPVYATVLRLRGLKLDA